MVEHAQQLGDLDDHHLSDVRFGRNRFLRALGVGLFSLATSMVVSREASASHGNPPPGCYGPGQCHCCYGSVCCGTGCTRASTCNGNQQCWQIARYAGGDCYNIYKCCDWWTRYGNLCICRGYLGKTC